MKPIDAEALKGKIMKIYLPADRLSAGVLFDLISTAPAIDPVYAAGGCYCRECSKKDTESCPMVEFEYVCPGDTQRTLFTANYDDGFCNYGERRKGEENE